MSLLGAAPAYAAEGDGEADLVAEPPTTGSTAPVAPEQPAVDTAPVPARGGAADGALSTLLTQLDAEPEPTSISNAVEPLAEPFTIEDPGPAGPPVLPVPTPSLFGQLPAAETTSTADPAPTAPFPTTSSPAPSPALSPAPLAEADPAPTAGLFDVTDEFSRFLTDDCWDDPTCRPTPSIPATDLALGLAAIPGTTPEDLYIYLQPYTDSAGQVQRPTLSSAGTRWVTRLPAKLITSALQVGLLKPQNLLGTPVFENPVVEEVASVGVSSLSNVGLNAAWQKADPWLQQRVPNGRFSSGLRGGTLAALPPSIAIGNHLADATTDALGCNPSSTDPDNTRYWCEQAVEAGLFGASVALPILADDLSTGRQLSPWSATPFMGAAAEKLVTSVAFGDPPPVPTPQTDAVRGFAQRAARGVAGAGAYLDRVGSLNPEDPTVSTTDLLASAPVRFVQGAAPLVQGLAQNLTLGRGSLGYPESVTASVMTPEQQRLHTENGEALVSTLGALGGRANDALNNGVLYPIGRAVLGNGAPEVAAPAPAPVPTPTPADPPGPRYPFGDWTVVQRLADGTEQVRWPDGSVGTASADGTVEVVNRYGNQVQFLPDGRIVEWLGLNRAVVSAPASSYPERL